MLVNSIAKSKSIENDDVINSKFPMSTGSFSFFIVIRIRTALKKLFQSRKLTIDDIKKYKMGLYIFILSFNTNKSCLFVKFSDFIIFYVLVVTSFFRKEADSL